MGFQSGLQPQSLLRIPLRNQLSFGDNGGISPQGRAPHCPLEGARPAPTNMEAENYLQIKYQVTSADARAHPDLLGDPRQRPPKGCCHPAKFRRESRTGGSPYRQIDWVAPVALVTPPCLPNRTGSDFSK
ncbi:hypothetical protein D4764_12G0005080 [Takifugu flavidus]|uniref:Uncharacterized protein n=1 Tax=Takifugu flavidus TaxID=433684 RepID=A0A5C6PEP0_9TELE|nr:hypothetical protein D4764_12G0005080 [Takifugu flavidus]